MTTQPNNPKRDAHQTYLARRADIDRLIDVLGLELGKYDERAQAEPKNWGFAGSADYVRSTLIDCIEGLSGIEREQIERFLAE